MANGGTIRRVEYESRSDVFRVYVLGDRHLGNAHSAEKAQIAIAKRIEDDDHALWLDMGDMTDAITATDRRHAASEQAKWLFGWDDVGQAEADRWCEINSAIFPKLIAMLQGNHEDTLWRREHHNVYETMRRVVEGVKVPKDSVALGHRGCAQLLFTRQGGSTWTYSMWLTHGSGGSRTPGAIVNKLKGYANQVDGVDMVLCGHYHRYVSGEVTKYKPTRGGMAKRTVRGYACPALCADMAYADTMDMDAVEPGYLVIEIEPDKKRVRVTREWV